MILYKAPVTAEELMNVSPKEMKQGMEIWLAWFEKWKNAIIDGGTPLGKGIHFTKNGDSKGKIEVIGYSIVEAKDMAVAKKMLANHPHFMMPKASIEVLEMMPMM